MSAQFRGPYAAMVTPFSDDGGQLSEPRLAAYSEFLIGQGVSGLFAFGTTGEWPLLSEEERASGASALVRQAAGRLPVIVHAGAHGTAQAVRLARAAREAGAAAASLISPPFYPLDEESLLAHFTAVARAVPGFPLFLYNIPEYAGNDITPGLLLRVARRAENVIGLKYSGDSLVRLADYRRVMGPDFSLFCGNDSLALAALEQGADGLVSGNASARPELLVSLYALFQKGERATAAGKQAELDRFIAGRQGASELSFFKALLELRGVPVGEVRPPLARLGAEGRAGLRRWLK